MQIQGYYIPSVSGEDLHQEEFIIIRFDFLKGEDSTSKSWEDRVRSEVNTIFDLRPKPAV